LFCPGRLRKRLGEVSVKMEISIEGLALDAFKGMNEGMDPAERAELYLRLSGKYLRDAEELLAKGGLSSGF